MSVFYINVFVFSTVCFLLISLYNPTTVIGIYSGFVLIMIQKLITLIKITSSIIIMMYKNFIIMHYGWQNYISVLLFMYYPKTMQGFLDKVKNYDEQKRLNFLHCLRSTHEFVLSSYQNLIEIKVRGLLLFKKLCVKYKEQYYFHKVFIVV